MKEETKVLLIKEAEKVNKDFNSNKIGALLIYGVNWYLNTIWHDSNKEQPTFGSTVLVRGEKTELISNCIKVNKNAHWAYVEDLNPIQNG